MNREEEIHAKGFNIVNSREGYEGPSLDYGKIKVGTKTLDDAVLNLGELRKVNRRFGDKFVVLKAMADRDLPLMREISNYFYNTNGMYSAICNYAAHLYRYDWYIVPEVLDESVKEEKILKDFSTTLNYLDNSYIKKTCGDIALNVIKNGAYYGCIVKSKKGLILQELPVNYCRSVYTVANIPVIEFNMKFFDDAFRDINYRLKVLKMFPDEFKKGYMLYKQGKLNNDELGLVVSSKTMVGREGAVNTMRPYPLSNGWYPLEPGTAVKFNFHNGDQPLFINAIPALLDLDTSQDLDRRKQAQQLQKIVVQQLPLDKNGDLIFDVDEARDIHNNAIEMLQHSIGTDVLTTFANIKVEDIADNNAGQQTDTLERMERAVYEAFGISRNLFNAEGNLSLEKSILDDESTLRTLVLQFDIFFNQVTQSLGTNKKKYQYKFYMLETTQYNYKDLSKMYKEQVQLGYSKMLPQIALGHSQSSIVNTAYFENNVLHLSEIMIPPLMSSTMNPEALMGTGSKTSSQSSGSNSAASGNENKGGRPTKAEGQVSEKTIQNKESMN